MKLATIHLNGRDRLGLSVGDRVLDLSAALAQVAGADAPRSMIELIEAWDEMEPLLIGIAARPDNFASIPVEEVSWRAPVPTASKLCCLALNNSANADRIMKGPNHPAMFVKPSSALVGHNQPIECKPIYGRVHPEPELAVIIGKRAKNVSVEAGFDHVFGYTIHNDLTSPTMRVDDTFHYRAIYPKADDPGGIEYVDSWVCYSGRYKCSDTFSPMGPWLVTRGEIADPHALTIACHHQGRLVTEDSTENLTYKTAEVISYLSQFLTLLPGDIVSLGTALKKSTAGSGGAVQNIDLNKLGGPVSVSIEGIGVLSNPVVQV